MIKLFSQKNLPQLSKIKLADLATKAEGSQEFFNSFPWAKDLMVFYREDQCQQEIYYCPQHLLMALAVQGQRPLFIDLQKQIESFRQQGPHPFTKVFDRQQLVVDLTAGFLADTAKLLAMGFQVRCYERFLPLILLIEQARRLAANPNLSFCPGEWKVAELMDGQLYYDPMYQQYSQKSASKGPMTWLRDQLSESDSPEKIIESLYACKKNFRLLVKSWRQAKALVPERLKHRYQGKSTCYDLYLICQS